MRRLSLFAIIFIVMAALYWFLEGPQTKDAGREPGNLLSGLDSAHVERINISSARSGSIVLKRADKGWQVAADHKTFYCADSAAVEALIKSLATIKTGTIVSQNSSRHALYEVSPATGLQVEALGRGGTLANVLIGKSGPNIFSTYVRDADKDDVYLVDGILQNATSKSLNEWRDKTVFSFNPGLVTAYTVTGDPAFTLNKTDGKWRIGPEHAAANTAAAEQAVRAMATLSAADFAEGPLEEFGLAAPARAVTAEFDNGTKASLLFGSDANAFQQYAKTADKETIYIVEKHLLGMLCPTLEELTAPEAYAADAEAPAAPAKTQSSTKR
jgi:hypothetical protein